MTISILTGAAVLLLTAATLAALPATIISMSTAAVVLAVRS